MRHRCVYRYGDAASKNASEVASNSLAAQAGGVKYTPVVGRAYFSLSVMVES